MLSRVCLFVCLSVCFFRFPWVGRPPPSAPPLALIAFRVGQSISFQICRFPLFHQNAFNTFFESDCMSLKILKASSVTPKLSASDLAGPADPLAVPGSIFTLVVVVLPSSSVVVVVVVVCVSALPAIKPAVSSISAWASLRPSPSKSVWPASSFL